MFLKMKPRYAKRLRQLFAKYRPAGVARLSDSQSIVLYTPGRQEFTDRLVSRLFKIGVIRAVVI